MINFDGHSDGDGDGTCKQAFTVVVVIYNDIDILGFSISDISSSFYDTMATGGPSTSGATHLYEEDDVLEDRFLDQISQWIMYDQLPSLARHLGLPDNEISRIMTTHKTLEEQCFQVCMRH